MHLLITGGQSRLARALAGALAREHTVRLAASGRPEAEDGETGGARRLPASVEQVAGDLRDPRRAASDQPLPAIPPAPHEMREVDVTDPKQVLAARGSWHRIVGRPPSRPTCPERESPA